MEKLHDQAHVSADSSWTSTGGDVDPLEGFYSNLQRHEQIALSIPVSNPLKHMPNNQSAVPEIRLEESMAMKRYRNDYQLHEHLACQLGDQPTAVSPALGRSNETEGGADGGSADHIHQGQGPSSPGHALSIRLSPEQPQVDQVDGEALEPHDDVYAGPSVEESKQVRRAST